MFVKLGRVPGGFTMRNLAGGAIVVVHASRLNPINHRDLILRYAHTSDSAMSSALSHTALARMRWHLKDRARAKAERSKRRY